jgi:hypothetical protein
VEGNHNVTVVKSRQNISYSNYGRRAMSPGPSVQDFFGTTPPRSNIQIPRFQSGSSGTSPSTVSGSKLSVGSSIGSSRGFYGQEPETNRELNVEGSVSLGGAEGELDSIKRKRSRPQTAVARRPSLREIQVGGGLLRRI